MYYGVDLVDFFRTLSPSPRVMLAYVYALPLGCRTRALLVGSDDEFGRSREVIVCEDVYDAIVQNTVLTTMRELKQLPEFYPRPKRRDTVQGDGSLRGLHALLSKLQ